MRCESQPGLSMKISTAFLLSFCIFISDVSSAQDANSGTAAPMLGFHNSAAERKIEAQFLAVPDPALAEAHLRTLTQAPHMAGSAEDKATADYVAKKFREAGLETEIVEYRVWMNYPQEISVDVTAPPNVKMHGPSPEHVAADLFQGDPFQDDPRITTAFNGMAPSGDIDAEAVYANSARRRTSSAWNRRKPMCAGKSSWCVTARAFVA